MRIQMIPLTIGLLLAAPGAQAGQLHDAARKGDIAAIAAALDGGADVNEYNGQAEPLHYAVRKGHYSAAKFLIGRGANVNAATNYWGEPLMAAAQQTRADLMALLLESGAIPNSTHGGETALHVAVKFGCLDCVRALVEAGADVNVLTFENRSCVKDRTPLHIATLYGYPEIASYLKAHGATIPSPPPINSRLAAADAARGHAYFERNCLECHITEPVQGRGMAPNLWDVVGRDKASLPYANYSKTLQTWGGAWTYEDLNTFLYGPMLTMPGVKMQTPAIPDETVRADLIAYLRTLSDNPTPLP